MSRMEQAIRNAVKASDQTAGAIAKGAGVARSQLSRLLSGERGLNAESIERIADFLGLEIVIRPKVATKGNRK